MADETQNIRTTGSDTPCNCCGDAHPECCCGDHIVIDPCIPVQDTMCKIIKHADNVEQACVVENAENVGTLYEGIQSLEAGRLIRIDGTNRINVTLTAGDGIAIDEDTGKISSTMRSLEAGRLTKITQDGKVSSTLQAGKNVSIDEETGLISAESGLSGGDLTEITEDGKINCILEAGRLMEIDANRMACKVQGGDLIAIDESTGTVDCTLTAGRLMTLEGNIISSKVAAGTNISVDEQTGNIDCTLQAGNLMEITEDGTMNVTLTAGDGITIDEGTGEISNSLNLQAGRLTEITRQGDATVIASTLQGGYLTQINGNVVESTLTAGDHIDIAGNAISATYKAGNGIEISGDNINVKRSYGIMTRSSGLGLYVHMGKGIKNLTQSAYDSFSNGVLGYRSAFTPALDLAAGDGIAISAQGYGTGPVTISTDLEAGEGVELAKSGSKITISVAETQKTDCLFDQADSVRGNDTDIFHLYKSRANNSNNIKILDAAQGMPDHAMVDLTGAHVNFKVKGVSKYLLGQQSTETDDTFSLVEFHAEEVGTGTFDIRISLDGYMPSLLASKVDRVIAAASPLWLANGVIESDIDERLYQWKHCFGGFFESRKAVSIPEEAAFLVYRSYLDTTRLHDRLSAYSGERTAHSETLYQFFEERDVYPNFDVYKYFMGRTYSEMAEFDPNFYAMSGNFHLDNNYSYEDIWIDSFFGCFPGYIVECLFIEDSDLVIRMKSFHESVKIFTIPVPRLRIFFPKNEIIRKVRQMLADGEIDEYGNSLTQSTSEQPDDTQTEAAQQADNSETTINKTDDGNTDEQ